MYSYLYYVIDFEGCGRCYNQKLTCMVIIYICISNVGTSEHITYGIFMARMRFMSCTHVYIPI